LAALFSAFLVLFPEPNLLQQTAEDGKGVLSATTRLPRFELYEAFVEPATED